MFASEIAIFFRLRPRLVDEILQGSAGRGDVTRVRCSQWASSWSPTVTSCVADAVVLDASVAVHVTVVVPSKYGPAAGLAASVIGGVPPVVVGVPRLTCASQRPTSVATR